jgi:ribosomal protein S18 acetylase RimI-like enzyme
MNCKYRIADKADIDLLLEMRLEFVKDIHPEYDKKKIEELSIGSYQYIKKHIEKDMYIGFFGEVNNQIACSTSLLIYNYPPLFSAIYRKIGHVLNFYTRPQYRNKGYGNGLMEYVKQQAKNYDTYKLDLTATKTGYPLYKKCGFVDSERIMEYEIL